MKCPTCGVPMHPTNSTSDFWCEGCGTFINSSNEVHVPKLVDGCQRFEQDASKALVGLLSPSSKLERIEKLFDENILPYIHNMK